MCCLLTVPAAPCAGIPDLLVRMGKSGWVYARHNLEPQCGDLREPKSRIYHRILLLRMIVNLFLSKFISLVILTRAFFPLFL